MYVCVCIYIYIYIYLRNNKYYIQIPAQWCVKLKYSLIMVHEWGTHWRSNLLFSSDQQGQLAFHDYIMMRMLLLYNIINICQAYSDIFALNICVDWTHYNHLSNVLLDLHTISLI